jgi:DNA-binding transcriptional LysR family regulator
MDTSATKLRLPPLAAIRAFESAARLGSFERASEELNVTASAVGKRVASLERLVGIRLLNRQKSGVRPTVAGLEYVGQVRQALALLSSVSLHQLTNHKFRLLRICAPPTFAREILVPGIADFGKRHPDIEVDIVLSVPYLGLRPPGAHVEILADNHPEQGTEILGGESMRAACTSEYARRLRLKLPTDLQRAMLIRCPLEPWAPWFESAGLAWSEPARGIRLVDSGMTTTAATNGLGVALVRPSLCGQQFQRGELVTPFGVRSPPTTRYSMRIKDNVTARDEIGDAASIFSDWLSELCQRVIAKYAD